MSIEITDQEVIVFGSNFVKHDGYCQRTGPLIRALHNLRDEFVDKNLRVIFSDGEPFESAGFDFFLQKIANDLNLLSDRIILDMIDHHPRYVCDWATVTIRPSDFFRQAKTLVNVDQCKMSDNPKLFGAVYGRLTHSRMIMAYMLETEFPDDSFVIFQPGKDFVDFEFDPVANQFTPMLDWYANRQETNRDLRGSFNGLVSSHDCLPRYHEIFGKYHIELVIETNTQTQGWFTEKTAKCLVAGKPFIMYNTVGQLSRLREMGFQTFSDLLDESYDTITNDEQRFDAIQQEIRRLAKQDFLQRQELLTNLQKISNYNRDNYANIIKEYYK